MTNLNRQQYTVEQLGQYKTQALAETLRRIAPYCEILTDTVRVTEENLPALLEKDGIVCEAFDRPEAKAMLVSGVLEHFPDKPLVAASGMAGLGRRQHHTHRRAFGRLYLCGDGTSDVSGVLGLVSAPGGGVRRPPGPHDPPAPGRRDGTVTQRNRTYTPNGRRYPCRQYSTTAIPW